MYQSKAFYRGYRKAALAIAKWHQCESGPTRLGEDLRHRQAIIRKLSGAARYYQLGIEAAILDAFGC